MAFCPASGCPLIAPNGSPWTGEKMGVCPQHDDIDNGGCPWWSMACGVGGVHEQVDNAIKAGGRADVAGPNKPRKASLGAPKEYNCPHATDCSWQIEATKNGLGGGLCGPRYALANGADPRVCLF